jgi:hypothetical protein
MSDEAARRFIAGVEADSERRAEVMEHLNRALLDRLVERFPDGKGISRPAVEALVKQLLDEFVARGDLNSIDGELDELLRQFAFSIDNDPEAT